MIDAHASSESEAGLLEKVRLWRQVLAWVPDGSSICALFSMFR